MTSMTLGYRLWCSRFSFSQVALGLSATVLLSACGGGGTASTGSNATGGNLPTGLAASVSAAHASVTARPTTLAFRVVNTSGVKCAALPQDVTPTWDKPANGTLVLFDDFKDGKELCYISHKDCAEDLDTIRVTLKQADGGDFPGGGALLLNMKDTCNTTPDPPAPPPVANRAPTADAGTDQQANKGATVTLSGNGSTDPDGDTLTYAWAQTGTPAVSLSATNVANPTFTAPAALARNADTTLTFTLTVSDGRGGTATDTVSILIPRFIKIDSSGVEQPATAPAWSCVRDNSTGLIWEGKTDDSGLHDKDDRYTWYSTDALTNGGSNGTATGYSGCYGYNAADSTTYCNTEAFVNRVNAASWCGAGDWRMPTRTELKSIVDSSRYNPAINTAYFPNTRSYYYWSGTIQGASGAWVVSFNSGVDDWFDRNSAYAVRLVRSGQ